MRSGSVSGARLRGPRFRRVYPNVYAHADSRLDLNTRSRAAYLLIVGHGALAGYSAAELLGAVCAPRDADAEIVVPGGDFREYPGLRVHRDRLADDEVVEAGGVLVTSAVRTAYDLARWLPLTEAVAAVDALARTAGFPPRRILDIYRRYPGARWRRRVPGVVALSDPGAESVMESRLRLVLVTNGLPAPTTQHRVYDEDGMPVARLDMAYEDERLGIEYDGGHHRSAREFALDRRRDNKLDDLGWRVLRFVADDVMNDPNRLAAQVQAALLRRRTSMRRAS